MPGNAVTVKINDSDNLEWYIGDSRMAELIGVLSAIGVHRKGGVELKVERVTKFRPLLSLHGMLRVARVEEPPSVVFVMLARPETCSEGVRYVTEVGDLLGQDGETREIGMEIEQFVRMKKLPQELQEAVWEALDEQSQPKITHPDTHLELFLEERSNGREDERLNETLDEIQKELQDEEGKAKEE